MTDNIKLPLTSADMTEALLAQLRAASWAKIQCGRAHFDTLCVDFAHVVSASEIG